MNLIRSLLLSLLFACAMPAASQPGAPETKVTGPARFCGALFFIDLAEGETGVREQGPDFVLYFLQGPNGGFGLYEGFAPDTFENSSSPVQVGGFQKVERLRSRNGEYSYLIDLSPSGTRKYYLHLYGQVWKGNDADLTLLSRVKLHASKIDRCGGDPE